MRGASLGLAAVLLAVATAGIASGQSADQSANVTVNVTETTNASLELEGLLADEGTLAPLTGNQSANLTLDEEGRLVLDGHTEEEHSQAVPVASPSEERYVNVSAAWHERGAQASAENDTGEELPLEHPGHRNQSANATVASSLDGATVVLDLHGEEGLRAEETVRPEELIETLDALVAFGYGRAKDVHDEVMDRCDEVVGGLGSIQCVRRL